jgi:hypothetical protein
LKLPEKILNKKIKTENVLQQQARAWMNLDFDETFRLAEHSVILRSRKEKETEVFPDRLYSSIKYELNCTLKNVPPEINFLFVK